MEAPEHLLALIGRNPRPAIVHLDHAEVIPLQDAHVDGRMLTGIVDGGLYDVANQDGKPITVATHDRLLVDAQMQLLLTRCSRVLELSQRCRGEAREIDAPSARR